MRYELNELRPLLASSLLHLAWPKERQIAYLKEIGFHRFEDDRVPTDELIFEFYHGISTARAGVESGIFTHERYAELLGLERALIALEDEHDNLVSSKLHTKSWQDIRTRASNLVKSLGISDSDTVPTSYCS